jgi:hypothetical protein
LDGTPGMTTSGIAATLKDWNHEGGIPGGPAGLQWTPPAPKPTPKVNRKAKDPDSDDDDDVPELEDTPVETWPDTLREFCTYFEQNEDRVAAIVRMLDYCRLVTFDGHEVTITPLGSTTLAAMEDAEELERAKPTGRLSPVQQYLFGDERDTVKGSTVTALPLGITEAVRIATEYHQAAHGQDPQPLFDKLSAATYAPAISSATRYPGNVVDIDTGEDLTDAELPLRRNLHRRPSYRQFLWIAANDKNTFVLAMIGVTPENTLRVGTKSVTGDAERVRKDPDLAALKAARTLARKIRPFAQMVLTGGPEGVWVGKPIMPKDVHSDVTAFLAASRAGFSKSILEGSSLAWEAFETCPLSIRDFEEARSALHEGYGAGLVARGAMPETAPEVNEVAVAAAAIAKADGKKLNLHDADKFVTYTADQILEEIGVDVDVRPVITPSGMPMEDMQCRHQNVHINSETGLSTAYPCYGKSIGGSGYCERHGGTYLSPEETQSLVRASQQKLFAGGSKATEVMIDLMLRSSNDAVRLRAAEQILNRIGLNESKDLNVNLSERDKNVKSASQSVRERIMGLSGLDSSTQQAIETDRENGEISDYGEVIDAETEEVDG